MFLIANLTMRPSHRGGGKLFMTVTNGSDSHKTNPCRAFNVPS